jgi:SecD/SecF fusion protein
MMHSITSFIETPASLFFIGLLLLVLFIAYFATGKERRRRNVGTALTIAICSICLLAIIPPRERLKGGIDILGGSSFTLRVQEKEGDDGTREPLSFAQVEQAMAVIDNRLNHMGTADSLIVRQGVDRILVQMPGVEPEDSAAIRETLESVARLELREVSPRNDEIDASGKTLARRVVEGSEIVPGYLGYNITHRDGDGKTFSEPILLSLRTALGGADIARAFPSPERFDAVGVTLNAAGTKKMINLTSAMHPGKDRIAIVLDGEVISAPVVESVPLGKDFSISGLDDKGEVEKLANALMNPLENPLIVEASSSVSASFGSAIIKQGIWAGVIGLGITFLFVLIYYRSAGLVAILGLIVNAVILFGVMALFGFTFTLPGIAGMILTIGMAVDANVLIYERLREEIRSGRSVSSALSAAYEKAFTAIFDANLTSLITALLLFWLASGTIRGFAVTLTIGLLASMFSAILVTRVVFHWGVDSGILKRLSFLNLFPPTKIDFLCVRKACAACSLGLVLLTFGTFLVKNQETLGIDFTGGTLIHFDLGESELPMARVMESLAALPLTKEAYPQSERSAATGTILSIRCATGDAESIISQLRETMPLLGERDFSGDSTAGSYRIAANVEEVSAVIGGTFLVQSLTAIGLGLVGIFLYIAMRFEWSFAVGGFVATVHDVVITLGIVVLLGGELSLIHIGAILTVAGYSVNDTIVIFDRIRESLLVRAGSVKELINEAINATLSRTLLTSSTTIVTVAVLLVFGGSALRDFSITILIGLVVGTYSSIFIASPIVLWVSGRKGGDLRKAVSSDTRSEIETPCRALTQKPL